VPTSLRQLSRFLGIVLSLACIAFVAWRFSLVVPQIGQLAEWPATLWKLCLATLIYAVGGVCLAFAWWLLLSAFASSKIPLHAAARGHMLAQLAKYLPGNVFHLAARHVHARRSGLNHSGVATAAVSESLLLVVVALLLSMALPQSELPMGLHWLAPWRWTLVAGLLAALIAGLGLWRHRARRADMDVETGSGTFGILGASVSYLAFFLLATCAFGVLVGSAAVPLRTLLSMVTICWLGGFLIIGAPGGLGVREALFVGLLGPILGDAEAVYAALAFRAVTMLGDSLVFGAGFLVKEASD
jgi:glycosyltransferase 2 family protein